MKELISTELISTAGLGKYRVLDMCNFSKAALMDTHPFNATHLDVNLKKEQLQGECA